MALLVGGSYGTLWVPPRSVTIFPIIKHVSPDRLSLCLHIGPCGHGASVRHRGGIKQGWAYLGRGVGAVGLGSPCLWLCGRVLCLATDRLQSPGSHQETPRASQGVSLGTGQEGVAGTGTNWGGYLKTLEPKSFKKQETQTVIFLTHT